MQRKTLIHAECPIARSLERVGEWWSILIMRDALHGLRRFEEFSRSLDIAPNMLTRRLNSLVEAGLLERQPYSQRPLRYQYVPTAKGEDFRVVLMAFVAWGNRHYAPEGESVQIVERETGRPVLPMMADIADGRLVPLDQCSVQAGPAASAGMRQRLELTGAVVLARRSTGGA
ncbi:winged helix-turn-helix transcriptional regulator [Pseudomonas veronii]